ncbi:HIT family protein [Spirillospora sp. NBC_01491]|uniref:HIT family protein n=1 Tax=Spirillospora sp. NBC_01491 TaxID=2976007 RepID=UPI002E334B1E|nr:hypothetical protein [Spirillospora sp. NBC_01491]
MRPVVLEDALTEPSERDGHAADCVLCPPLRFRFNDMAGLPGGAAVLAADADFFLMPDLAPLADGHLLLVTEAHHPSAGTFGGRMWARACVWRGRIARIYREAYGTGELVMFEHGPASPQGGGACIDHAHWHFLPGSPGVRAVVERSGPHGVPADHDSVRDRVREGRSYLLLEEGETVTLHPGEGVPSQFLRWAAATALLDDSVAHKDGSVRAWRWQETFGLPESKRSFQRTLDALRSALREDQRTDSHQ